MRIIVLLLGLMALGLSSPVTAIEGSTQARAMGEAFLNAMGGREPWGKARWVHSWAVNHHPEARTVYTQEAWIALNETRQYIKLRNFDMDRDRALDLDRAWRLSEGKFSWQSDQEVAKWQEGLQKSIYWKLHALAQRDKALELAVGESGRLEFRKNGTFLGWLILNEDGSPQMQGGYESGDISTTFGELLPFGPINWVRSGEETTGWGFELLSIKLGEGPLPVSTLAPEPDQTGN